MDKRTCPIGIFDSGVGGISVLRQLIALMPNEDYLFFGDSKNAPYGTKSFEEVQRLACADAEYLLSKKVKALVVACNTATSAAIQILRNKYSGMPVIGIEPALKPAVLSASGKKPAVLVMATPMTLREEKFHQLMMRYEQDATIIPLPCPGLMEFVERGELSGAALEAYLGKLFQAHLRNPVDCVVLGCTHYPFVRDTIQKMLGDKVAIFDGGGGTARETHRRLAECGLLSPFRARGRVTIENSSESREITDLCSMLLKI